MDVSVTLKDAFYGCICYIEGCLVVYSVSESDFVRRGVIYVCLRAINTSV